MKTWWLVGIFFLLVWSTKVGAQQAGAVGGDYPRLALGLQGIAHWNTVTFSPEVAQGAYLGQGAALVARYLTQPHLGIQLELSYEQRGWQEEIDTLSATYTRTYRQVGLAMLTYAALGKGKLQPLLLAGPFVGLPLADTEQRDAGWPVQRADYGAPLPRRLAYGLTGGLGLGYQPGGPLSVQAEGRYRTGLSSLFPLNRENFNFSNPKAWEVRVSLWWNIR